MATTDKGTLEGKVAAELHQIATDLGIEGHKGLKKADLVQVILTRTNGDAPSTPAPAETSAPAAAPAQASPAPSSASEASADTRGPGGNTQHEDRPAAPAGALRTTRRSG